MGFASFYCKPALSRLNPSRLPPPPSPPGVVRLEQKNDSFLEMGIYDDGPFEVGDENEKNPDLVPAPANSYLGKSPLALLIHEILHHHFSCSTVKGQRSIFKYLTTSDYLGTYSYVSVSQASLWTRGRV